MRPGRETLRLRLVVGALLVLVVLAGVALRAKEPASSPALGAEDPYTHVVFTKEAMERGWFGDSWYLGTGMYPPGLHALAGVVAPLAGVDVYDFARWAPVAFGALAVLGTYLLAARLGGSVAGLAAALLVAAMPEHVFRTDLFFPTALDLALIPAWLLLFHLAAVPRREEGWETPWRRSPARVAAGVGFLVLAAPLAILHPWVVPLFALPALAYASLQVVRSRASSIEEGARRVAPAAGLAVVATAFAMATRWSESDTGFADFFGQLGPLAFLEGVSLPPPALFAVLALVLGALAAAGAFAVGALAAANARAPSRLRLGVSALLAAALLAAVAALSLGRELPLHVEYPTMLGHVAVALALAGVVVAALRPTRLGDMGLAVAAPLFPLTAVNLFGGEFWPQRTVAYLGVGVALLAALAVAWGVTQAVRLAGERRQRVVAPVAVVAAMLLLAGSVAAQPAPVYPWYRLYEDDDFAGFQRTADLLAEDRDVRVIAYPWQPSLMVKALAEPHQARYAKEFFASAEARADILEENDGNVRYVIVDEYLEKKAKRDSFDLSFLDGSGYRLVVRSADGSFRLYEVVRG